MIGRHHNGRAALLRGRLTERLRMRSGYDKMCAMKNYKKRVLGLVLGGRIKSVGVILFTGVLPVAAATFPLEWNATYDTSVPREVEILPAKLVGMGLMR